jgi:hypothetical protein
MAYKDGKKCESLTHVSLENKSLPGASGPATQYSSKTVLSKVGSSSDSRPPQYKLENKPK